MITIKTARGVLFLGINVFKGATFGFIYYPLDPAKRVRIVKIF